MADRVGVINHGEIIRVQEKHELMQELGRKQLIVHLLEPLTRLPDMLAEYALELADEGTRLVYTYETRAARTGITTLLGKLGDAGIRFHDLDTSESSLEEIFVGLVRQVRPPAALPLEEQAR
jgi:ABC-2 type transport system ATP-binding protein